MSLLPDHSNASKIAASRLLPHCNRGGLLRPLASGNPPAAHAEVEEPAAGLRLAGSEAAERPVHDLLRGHRRGIYRDPDGTA